jgi:hypothetical protein
MRFLFDRLVDLWLWVRRASGLDRVSKTRRAQDYEGRGRLWRILYWVRPTIAIVVILYIALLVGRFSFIANDGLDYHHVALRNPEGLDAGEQMSGGVCAPSDIASMSAHILDILVNQNTWVPSDPQYKIGWFGLIGFAPTPFFDNKASFQIGALRVVRRISIEMVDLIGRQRGTSAADADLEDARASVQWNERAWVFNPFDSRLPLLSTSAASEFRSAIANYNNYNARLERCDALFDPRADNLFQLLDRLANDLGNITDQLGGRSKAHRWDVPQQRMIEAGGNNRGFFDFHADNLFHEARGMAWAYHGYLRAIRDDFDNIIGDRSMSDIWDRMEIAMAESADLNPIIVSNGREDSLFAPDHLSAMASNMLRARANMTELREILNR